MFSVTLFSCNLKADHLKSHCHWGLRTDFSRLLGDVPGSDDATGPLQVDKLSCSWCVLFLSDMPSDLNFGNGFALALCLSFLPNIDGEFPAKCILKEQHIFISPYNQDLRETYWILILCLNIFRRQVERHG